MTTIMHSTYPRTTQSRWLVTYRISTVVMTAYFNEYANAESYAQLLREERRTAVNVLGL